MTEGEFQDLAEAECQRLQLLYHHCTQPRRCHGPRGFPDLLALGPGGLFLGELKGPDGETSAEQDEWVWTAHTAGREIGIYDSTSPGRLMAALARIAR